MRHFLFYLVMLFVLPVHSQTVSKFFKIEKISNNVYAFIPPRPMADIVHGNSTIIVGEDGVLVIDTFGDDIIATEAIKEIKKITSKPVKYILNTHWHYDHIGGNRTFRLAFPNAILIVQKNALPSLKKLVIPNFKSEPKASTDLLNEFTAALKTGMKNDSTSLTKYEKDIRYPETIADLQFFIKNSSSLKFSYQSPDITFSDSLTLDLGKDTIQIFHPGWGHSPDDAMVYIQSQKILITGDIVVGPIPYAFNTIQNDWIKILHQIILMANVNVIVPGHGDILKDKKYVADMVGLLETTSLRIKQCYDKGYSQQQTTAKIVMDDYRDKFAGTDPIKQWAFDNYFLKPRIKNYYKQFHISN